MSQLLYIGHAKVGLPLDSTGLHFRATVSQPDGICSGGDRVDGMPP